MQKNKFTKVFVIGSGIAFLASSGMGISSMIGGSIDRPAQNQNAAQSQNAQLQAEEKGFATV